MTPTLSLRPLIEKILGEYALLPEEIHGVAHWARGLENGLRLAKTTGADVEVVQLFAIFHDSKRENEGYDPDHGQRAADFAKSHRGEFFELEDEDFLRLFDACAGHTHETSHPDITLQTCWDADRLDLGRVGIRPDPIRLCTDAARKPKTIRWAHRRACSCTVPGWVLEDWGVDLSW